MPQQSGISDQRSLFFKHGSLFWAKAFSFLVMGSFSFLLLVQSAAAQEDDYGKWKKQEQITRPVTRKRPRPVTITAPLLTMRWQFLVASDQKEQPVNPKSRDFVDGERARIAVQVNQNGYLYVINHTVKGDNSIEGPLLISRGQYSVKKDQQQVIPVTCPDSDRKNGKCWWTLKQPAGLEVVTIIFSRDEIDEWKDFNSDDEDPPVSESLVHEKSRESPNPQRKAWTVRKGSRPVGLNGPHVAMVWNPNLKNNEVLVERIEFNHK
jgi:hypothetical protein